MIYRKALLILPNWLLFGEKVRDSFLFPRKVVGKSDLLIFISFWQIQFSSILFYLKMALFDFVIKNNF